jgi:hypothetical protein
MITLTVDDFSMDGSDIDDIKRRTKTYGRAKVKIYLTTPMGRLVNLDAFASYRESTDEITFDLPRPDGEMSSCNIPLRKPTKITRWRQDSFKRTQFAPDESSDDNE